MRIFAITTRDFYSIATSDCEFWQEIECQRFKEFISKLCASGDVENFYLDEDDRTENFQEYWGREKSFRILKRKVAAQDQDTLLYVIPSIPVAQIEEKQGKCKEIKERHNYVGTFLECILEDLGEDKETNAKEIFVVAHDRDIYSQSAERSMDESDLFVGSVLEKIIAEKKIIIDNIYGFQHVRNHGYLYPLFSNKLCGDTIENSIFEDIENKIKESSSKIKQIAKDVDSDGAKDKKENSKAIKTAEPLEPILFNFTINVNGDFECEMPPKYGELGLEEYVSLVNAVKKALADYRFKSDPGSFSVQLLIHHKKMIQDCVKEQRQYVYGQNYFFNSQSYYPIIHFCDATIKELNDYFRYSAIVDSSIWNYYVQIKSSPEESNVFIVSPEQLYNSICNIAKYSNAKLYDLVVAKEVAELNARLTYNSYICRFPNSQGHADSVSPFVFHSEYSVGVNKEKFTFCHFEQQRWRILLVDDKSKDALKPKKLKITKLQIIERLLKDLFGNENVESREYRVNDENANENDKQAEEANRAKDGRMQVEYVETLEDAEKALKSKKYDIILLDYLLEKEGKGRQYGYELLENIYNYLDAKKTFFESSRESVMNDVQATGATPKTKYESYLVREAEEIEKLGDGKDDEDTRKEIRLYKECKKIICANCDKINSEIAEEVKKRLRSENRECAEKIYCILKKLFEKDKYQIGPHGKLFFMFISAYTTAVYERLLAQGLNRNEVYWYIGEGACPTNTPELFKYRLLHIMDRRLDQTGIKRLSYENILNVVKKIYERGNDVEKKKDRITSVRRRANDAYHKILGFHYDYFLLKDKDKGKSALVDNFLKGKDHFGAMLEHLLQLVHLTAFGTVRQWPEIWEECQFLMRTIDDKKGVESLKNEIEAAIESYVIDLKSE